MRLKGVRDLVLWIFDRRDLSIVSIWIMFWNKNSFDGFKEEERKVRVDLLRVDLV